MSAEPPRHLAGDGADRGARSFPMAMAGTVKFYNAERGYGFIKPDDGGRDVFVHVTAVERAGLKSLSEGQRLSFDVEPDKKGKGPKAINLVIGGGRLAAPQIERTNGGAPPGAPRPPPPRPPPLLFSDPPLRR